MLEPAKIAIVSSNFFHIIIFCGPVSCTFEISFRVAEPKVGTPYGAEAADCSSVVEGNVSLVMDRVLDVCSYYLWSLSPTLAVCTAVQSSYLLSKSDIVLGQNNIVTGCLGPLATN